MALLKFKVYTQDKTNRSRFFNVGEEVEISDEKRVADIVSRGLADVVGKAEPAEPTHPETVEVAEAPKPKGRPKAKTE